MKDLCGSGGIMQLLNGVVKRRIMAEVDDDSYGKEVKKSIHAKNGKIIKLSIM